MDINKRLNDFFLLLAIEMNKHFFLYLIIIIKTGIDI